MQNQFQNHERLAETQTDKQTPSEGRKCHQRKKISVFNVWKKILQVSPNLATIFSIFLHDKARYYFPQN